MNTTHLNIILQPTETVNTCKVSEVLPLLQIVAKQNKLSLNKAKDWRKAVYILKVSILNN